MEEFLVDLSSAQYAVHQFVAAAKLLLELPISQQTAIQHRLATASIVYKDECTYAKRNSPIACIKQIPQ